MDDSQSAVIATVHVLWQYTTTSPEHRLMRRQMQYTRYSFTSLLLTLVQYLQQLWPYPHSNLQQPVLRNVLR